jgi:hypothetical protein
MWEHPLPQSMTVNSFDCIPDAPLGVLRVVLLPAVPVPARFAVGVVVRSDIADCRF